MVTTGTVDVIKGTFSYFDGQGVDVLFVTFRGEKKTGHVPGFFEKEGLNILSYLYNFTHNSAVTINLYWLKCRV